MNGRADLLELSGLIGIRAQYTDALGRTRNVSDDTLLALIAAFGLPPNAWEARRELEEHKQHSPLGIGAAHLAHAEELHPKLWLSLPASCTKIAWNCRLEDGAERCGKTAVGAQRQRQGFALPLPRALPLGYHRLEIEAGGVTAH